MLRAVLQEVCAVPQQSGGKKPAVARAGDTLLGDEKMTDAKKGKDTHEELWPWVVNAWAGTPVQDRSHGQPMQGQEHLEGLWM